MSKADSPKGDSYTGILLNARERGKGKKEERREEQIQEHSEGFPMVLRVKAEV